MEIGDFVHTWGPILTVVACSAATALLTVQSNEDQLRYFSQNTEENFKKVYLALDKNSETLGAMNSKLEEGQKQVALQDLKLTFISGRVEDLRSDMEKEAHMLWSLARENQANIKALDKVMMDREIRVTTSLTHNKKDQGGN